MYIQHDSTLHSLFYLQTALNVSGGTITHNQERKQLYLQHLLFVKPLLLSGLSVLWVAYTTHRTLKPAADGNNGLTNNRCCRYSCLRS
jgi:hypothetical protein